MSVKFTRASLESSLAATDLTLAGWYTDPEQRFGLALAEAA
ncbi:MAG: hypothetical protein ACREQM_08680 [Candidatus Dormibacteraceae bacterium]